jgi:hypothetical protein
MDKEKAGDDECDEMSSVGSYESGEEDDEATGNMDDV